MSERTNTFGHRASTILNLTENILAGICINTDKPENGWVNLGKQMVGGWVGGWVDLGKCCGYRCVPGRIENMLKQRRTSRSGRGRSGTGGRGVGGGGCSVSGCFRTQQHLETIAGIQLVMHDSRSAGTQLLGFENIAPRTPQMWPAAPEK